MTKAQLRRKTRTWPGPLQGLTMTAKPSASSSNLSRFLRKMCWNVTLELGALWFPPSKWISSICVDLLGMLGRETGGPQAGNGSGAHYKGKQLPLVFSAMKQLISSFSSCWPSSLESPVTAHTATSIPYRRSILHSILHPRWWTPVVSSWCLQWKPS